MNEKPSDNVSPIPDLQWEQAEFRKKFKSVIERPLEVGSIHTYFDTIIDDLSSLTQELRSRYVARNSNLLSQTPREQEEEALKYFGLGNIHIDDFLTEAERKRQLVLQAQEYIQRIPESGRIISPPQEHGIMPQPSGEGKELHRRETRLTSLIFLLLSNGIDFTKVSVVRGSTSSEMFRQEGYVTMLIPELHRVVQVCDERGNATFIFDDQKLKENGISVEQIDAMTKDEKYQLLDRVHGIGVTLAHGEHWLARVEEFLYADHLIRDKKSFRQQRPSRAEELPQVSVLETDPWKGFWTDEQGYHWGNSRYIVNMIWKTYGIRLGAQKIELDVKKLDPSIQKELWKSVIVATRQEAKALNYEKLLELDFIKRALKIPSVDEEGEWKGLWLQSETGYHFGTIATLAVRLGQRHGAIQYLVKEMVERGEIPPPPTIRDLNGRELSGYPFELVREKVLAILELPLVNQGGEWKGFYFSPDRNEHVGTIKTIFHRIGIDIEAIKGVIEEMRLESMSLRFRGFQASKGYSLEAIVAHPYIAEWLELRDAGKVAIKDGDWKFFYTDTDGKHWGTIHAVSDRLRRMGIIRSSAKLKEDMAGMRVIRIVSKGGPRDAYCIEDILKNKHT